MPTIIIMMHRWIWNSGFINTIPYGSSHLLIKLLNTKFGTKVRFIYNNIGIKLVTVHRKYHLPDCHKAILCVNLPFFIICGLTFPVFCFFLCWRKLWGIHGFNWNAKHIYPNNQITPWYQLERGHTLPRITYRFCILLLIRMHNGYVCLFIGV